MNLKTAGVLGLALLPVAPAGARLSPDQLNQLPPAVTRPVDFKRDIKPIFDASCVKCHGRGKSKGGFQLDTRETFLKDADNGPAVVPGNSRDSTIVHLVSGLDPDNIMPEKGSRLTAEQVGLLRAWIDQGLPWDADVTFAREPHRNLLPRGAELPAASGDTTHPVDRFVWAYFAQHKIQPPDPVDDRTFARRVFLDVVGLLPSPEELAEFTQDTSPNKREQWVKRLLADRTRYAQHWLTFWNDLLRNDYRGTGYIDGGREQITQWLYTALRDNQPYDQFVRDLVSPAEKGPRGFTKGIVWRGAINASQTPPMQAAQNISQVFLGVNLKCASCHDSFIDDWQLSDAYGMAGVYAEDKLELVRCDKPLGTYAPVQFLFPELGSFEAGAPHSERIARLAELITRRENGRLPRTLINRLWARFFGQGLVEPLDVMQNPSWHPELLDWLAEDLAANAYDVKRSMELLLTSRAYQLPAVNLADGLAREFVFRGPSIRRLTAEQFRDALSQLTDTWFEKPEGGLDSLLFEKGTAESLPVDAFWVWSDPHAAAGAIPQTIYLLRQLELPNVPAEAVAFVNADNSHRLWVNGREARKKNDLPWNETSILDLRPFLIKGSNTFAIEAVNTGDSPNPAGLLFYARIRPEGPAQEAGTPTTGGKSLDFATDGSWLVATNKIEGWEKPGFDASGWAKAQVLGAAGSAPWEVGSQFTAAVSGRTVYGRVRSSLVSADPLTLALGRPNREQVTSSRSSIATTIQMLELTNGETLARLLKQGAEKLVTNRAKGPAVVEAVFARGLGRKPSPTEASLSLAIVGAPEPNIAGVEDLLWSVSMLPEFQLIQ